MQGERQSICQMIVNHEVHEEHEGTPPPENKNKYFVTSFLRALRILRGDS